MPIPESRRQLVESITASWHRLENELIPLDDVAARLVCVDRWTISDVCAVRAWWSQHVVEWIERGKRGDLIELPAAGYTWRETPRLNADIVESAREDSWDAVHARLRAAAEAVQPCIERLDDHGLLRIGVYAWAGKWPLSRWISINTVRQYDTARTYVRRALRGTERQPR
jgi:hypothetical protein